MGNATGGVGGNANRRNSIERQPSLNVSNISEGIKTTITTNTTNNNNDKKTEKRSVESNRGRSRSPNAKDPQGKERIVQNKNSNAGNDRNNKLNAAHDSGE